MCDLRVACAGFIALALAASNPVMGQSSAALQARLERLRREHASAIVAAGRADSARFAGIRLDTIRAGALTVLAPYPAGRDARSATIQAWRLLHMRFGDGGRVLEEVEFLLQAPGASSVAPLTRGTQVRPLLLPQQAVRRTVPTEETESRDIAPINAAFETTMDTDVLARWIAARAAAEVAAHQDTAFRNWLRDNIDVESDDPRRLEAAYVELVAEPWTAVRRCYLGDLNGCRNALGLVPQVDALDQWYDAEDRRRLVATGAADGYRRTRPVERAACVDGGNIDACTALLRRLPSLSIEPPFPSGQRALVEFALDRGGLGAYSRLMASPERPLADRLAAAAGLSEDSLLARWRARVIAAQPRPVTLTSAGAWAAFGWVLALSVLALQSSRWR